MYAMQTQTHGTVNARDGALRQALSEADLQNFVAALAPTMKTTPDKLSPALLEAGAALVKSLQDDPEPNWAGIREQIKNLMYLNSQGSRDFMDTCQSNDYDKYKDVGCNFAGGGRVVEESGRVVDAYYCGAREGIDWSVSPFNGQPLSDLCNAEVGTAYTPTGVCGSLTDKELVLNAIETVPLWGTEPNKTNIASLDCIMGIGDCDIYYCHHCAGRCP